jgi:hypothetical protein
LKMPVRSLNSYNLSATRMLMVAEASSGRSLRLSG